MRRREARVEEREHRQRGVPDRRLTGLETASGIVLDREAVETGESLHDHRVVEPVAERVQRDDRPHPRRLDPAPRAVRLLPLDDPALGRAERTPPERRDRLVLVAVQPAVECRERSRDRLARRLDRHARSQLADAERDADARLERRRDRERDERLPRPAAERVDRERRARGQEDLLRRERRHVLPRPQREQRQPHAGEDAGPFHSPEVADQLRRAAHVLGVLAVAGEPERDVRLDRRREVCRAAEEGRPAPVVALLRADPARGRRPLLRGQDAEVVADEEILGVDRHVGLELALPPAVGMLEREQVRGAARERLLRGVEARRGRQAHAALASEVLPLARSARAAAAAARPLRTALSIVAGQPVSVHAPAR